ncbi:MAG: YqzL family protein [Clostridia bacterium]|nr:YqzL family protein [Clostridia bacterium]
MWDMFTGTGNIDIYLKYKRHEELKAQRAENTEKRGN